MTTTGLEVFDETVHKTNRWLKEIEEVLGSDRHQAYQALRAVLHCLRDRLTVNEAAIGRPTPDARSWHLLRSVAPGRKAREGLVP
jgi:hypothetical protein